MNEVGCVGILVEDTFCGPMAKCPVEGQLVAVDAMPTKAGGCAANVAIDLVKQEVSVEIIGCVGCDIKGAALKAALEERGVDCRRLIFTKDESTSQTIILLVERQDRRYIHFFGANRALTVRQIPRNWVAGLKVFYLGGLGVMPGIRLEELARLLRFCRSKGVVTVVDVVISQSFKDTSKLCALLPHVDYFLPNVDEACVLTGTRDPIKQMRVLLDHGARTVIITQGETGVMAGRGKDIWRAASYPTRGIDSSGAGDAFASGVITGVLRSWDMPEILRYASALGASATFAISTTDSVFTSAEAAAYLQSNRLKISQSKI